MKTNSAILRITTLLSTAPLFVGLVAGQTGVINPATGLPATSSAATGGIDPATGLPASKPGEQTASGAVGEAFQAHTDVEKLIFNGQYEEALERCMAFHNKYKASPYMFTLLRDWVELGRRFPKAKDALIAIRDEDVREFAEGRGYSDLFREVHDINTSLNQDEATYALFISFRDKDPVLAGQCYSWVQNSLVAKGEYQWLYDHMGDPQTKFEIIHRVLTMQLEAQERMASQTAAAKQRIAQARQERGLPDIPASWTPDTSAMIKRTAENGFINQTRQLIEILVATGHKEDAEKIRDQAVAVIDDARLRSAVGDAEAKVKK